MHIIDGRKIKDKILSDIKKEVKNLPFVPVFSDVLVGNDPSSMQYVKMKARTAESLGIKFHSADFPSSITTEELVKEISILNKIENMCGIIVQLPLPESIDKKSVLDAIDPKLDVDCLGRIASEKFYKGEKCPGFPAALACIYLLDSLNIDLSKKGFVVLGQGELVGKPVTALLRKRGLSIQTVDKNTKDKEKIIKGADVIISGMGSGRYITGEMIRDGVIIIDAGTSESEGSIVGDVDMQSVKDKAGFISPVPGGVGPVTVAMLFKNVLEVAKSFAKA